jgi:hypothetical protein
MEFSEIERLDEVGHVVVATRPSTRERLTRVL